MTKMMKMKSRIDVAFSVCRTRTLRSFSVKVKYEDLKMSNGILEIIVQKSKQANRATLEH